MRYPARNLQQLCCLLARYDRPVKCADLKAGLYRSGEPTIRRINTALEQQLVYRLPRQRGYMLTPLGTLVYLHNLRWGGYVPTYKFPMDKIVRRVIEVATRTRDDVKACALSEYDREQRSRYLLLATDAGFLEKTNYGYFMPTSHGLDWLSLIYEYDDYAKIISSNRSTATEHQRLCARPVQFNGGRYDYRPDAREH